MAMKNKNKKEKIHITDTVKDVIDVYFYDDKLKCFIMKDKSYMDIIQINTKDLVSASEDDIEYDIMRYIKLYKMYADDMKIVAMNFPCRTGKQQEYFRHKLQNTSNEIYKRFLRRNLDELVWIEKNDMVREYYYMIFGKKDTDIKKNRDLMFNVLGKGRSELLSEMDKNKKIQILERMNNKCFLLN